MAELPHAALAATTLTRRRVRSGARLLEQHIPDFRERLKPFIPGTPGLPPEDQLDMGDGCGCVLGKLYGYYGEGLVALGLLKDSNRGRLVYEPALQRHAITHGFQSDPNRDITFSLLEAEWIREITLIKPQSVRHA